MKVDSLKKIKSIFIKDLQMAKSYKFSFISQYFYLFGQILLFYLISLYLDRELTEFNNLNFFLFILTGMCVFDFGQSIINYGPRELLSMKQSGILEEIIQLNINKFIFFMGINVYKIFESIIRLTIFLFIIIVFFDGTINLYETIILTISLLIFVFSCIFIGIIGSAFGLIIYKANIFTTIFILLSILFSNVYYPSEIILDGALDPVSQILSFTPMIEIFRAIISNESNLYYYYLCLIHLICLTIIYGVTSYFIFSFAIKKSKKNGSFLFY
jgi:ABC-type polysaccharide/polyol phosphate export permease